MSKIDKYCMVSCPSCGRPVGQYCTLGKPGTTVHATRVLAYNRWKASLKPPAKTTETWGGVYRPVYYDTFWRCLRPLSAADFGRPSSSTSVPNHATPDRESPPPTDRNKERRLDHMAANYTVYVPDSSRPLSFSKDFTPAEVKSALISSGNASVENSTMTVSADGNTITFARVQGGTKGL